MTTTPSVREELGAELAATRAAFHDLLSSLSDADWRRATNNPAWSVGHLLHHFVWSLELLPREVASARRDKGMFNLPPFLRDPLNSAVTRFGARNQSLSTVARRYDAAYTAALRSLDGVRDDEWRRGARFWGEGFIDIEGLFRSHTRHFAEHGQDIAAAVRRTQATTPDQRVHRGSA